MEAMSEVLEEARMTAPESSNDRLGDFYQVKLQAGTEGCAACGHGRLWTIIYTDADGEENEIGTAWGDEEHAQDICDLMNMAFDAGFEHSPGNEANIDPMPAAPESRDG